MQGLSQNDLFNAYSSFRWAKAFYQKGGPIAKMQPLIPSLISSKSTVWFVPVESQVNA